MTRLDGEILVFVLNALARRHDGWLRVLASGAPHLATAVVRHLQHAGIHTDWQNVQPDQNARAPSNRPTAVHAVLIARDASYVAPATLRFRVGQNGFILVHQHHDTTAPVFADFATAARIGHRWWIASTAETDLARFVPLRGLIEGDTPTQRRVH